MAVSPPFPSRARCGGPGERSVSLNLDGARVVVTGASRGLGLALAERLAPRGARLALVARSEVALREVADRFDGVAYPADLSETGRIDDLVGRIAADGPVDVLINNAGLDLTGSLTEVAAERVRELILVNLVAPIVLSRAVIPLMCAQGRGHIVNGCSGSATVPTPTP
jgi:short-subunit dehydrogenase